MCLACTYQRDHVDHGRVAGNKKQEGHLDGIGLVKVALLDLLSHQLAENVVLGLLAALVGELGEVAEEFANNSQLHASEYTKGGVTCVAAADASRAVELPLVRIEFCCVRNSRSSKGTPRIV